MSAAPLARRISIHALLAESDPRKAVTTRGNHRYFYPRSPCGERLLRRFPNMSLRIISIHALLAESDECKRKIIAAINISIHALLAESDPAMPPQLWRRFYFYPRSPCGERLYYTTINTHCQHISIHALLAESDKLQRSIDTISQPFLSTLSLRRATSSVLIIRKQCRNFYPRSPCGERRCK